MLHKPGVYFHRLQFSNLDAKSVYQLLEHIDSGIDLIDGQEFIGLVGLIDRTGAYNNGFGLHTIVVGRLGSKRDAAGRFASEEFQMFGDLACLGGIHRWRSLATDYQALAGKTSSLGNAGNQFCHIGVQRIERHTG